MPKMNAKEKNAANALKIMGKHKTPAKVEKAKPAKVEKVKAEKPSINLESLRDALAAYVAMNTDSVQAIDKASRAPSPADAIFYILGISFINPEKGITFTDAVLRTKNAAQVKALVQYAKAYYAGHEKYIPANFQKFIGMLESAATVK